jgi:hypothetical protein
MVYAFLACAVLVAVGVDAALQGHGARRVRVATALLLAAGAAALFPTLPFPSRAADVPQFFTTTAQRVVPQGSVAYVLPLVDKDLMLWQLRSGMRFRMVGGWFLGPDAHGHVEQGPAATPLSRAVADVEKSGDVIFLSDADLARYRQELRADHVRTVVVSPAEPNGAAVVEFFQRVTQTAPHDDGAGSVYFSL